MRRRRLLALLGAAPLAGCLDRGEATPEPLDVESLFADRCRSITDATGETASVPGPPSGCPAYTDAWPSYCEEDAPVAVTGPDAPIELPRGSATFTLHNRGDRPFTSAFECGQFYKYLVDGWRLAERPCNSAGFTLAPGEERSFELRIDNRELCSKRELGGWPDPTTLLARGLGPGHYRLLVNGALGEGATAEQVSVSGPFRVTGPPVPLVPGPDVVSAGVDGKEATVRSRQFQEASDRDRYKVTWERINPDAGGAVDVFVEDGFTAPAIRQPFPFFDVLEAVNTVHHYTDYNGARKGFVAMVEEGALERARYGENVYRMRSRRAGFG